MRIFPPELEIGPEDGFDPKTDIFKRAELGKGLTNIVTAVTDPTVIALDGQWGSGKTTFLAMWAGELRKAGVPVILFDAFANDYTADAFTALAGEIIGLLKSAKKSRTSVAKRFSSKAMEASKIILRSSLKIGVKAATMGALDAADFQNLKTDVSTETSRLADEYVGAMLTRRNEEKSIVSAFRQALSELPAVLVDKQDAGDQSGNIRKPLVFIIDELDRCRPLFALELLERVKHFFAVPGVHFLLGVNLVQLRNSVSVAYGSGIDSQAYLQKFIHLTALLDQRPRYRHERVSKNYIEYLRRRFEFHQKDVRIGELCCEMIESVSEERDLSLRAIERIFTTLALALEVTNERSLRLPPILAGLCILKVVEPSVYRKAKKGSLRFSDIEEIFFSHEGKDQDERHRIEWSKGWWHFCSDPAVPQEEVERKARELSGYSIQRDEIVPFIANNIIDRFVPRSA